MKKSPPEISCRATYLPLCGDVWPELVDEKIERVYVGWMPKGAERDKAGALMEALGFRPALLVTGLDEEGCHSQLVARQAAHLAQPAFLNWRASKGEIGAQN